jgi:hypothetical protein
MLHVLSIGCPPLAMAILTPVLVNTGDNPALRTRCEAMETEHAARFLRLLFSAPVNIEYGADCGRKGEIGLIHAATSDF